MESTRLDPTRFRPRDYYEAALDRLVDAQELHQTGRMGLGLTQAGVAAECILRAYFPEGEEFDGRHDLVEIARRSRLRPARLEAALTHDAAVQTLRQVWRNSYRYMTEDKMNAILRRIPRYQDGTGRLRALRSASRDAIEAATQLVNLGSNRWTSLSQ